jgi:TIR domain
MPGKYPQFKRFRESDKVELGEGASPSQDRPCIFISHKREDTDDCALIADYILNAGLDVYFDQQDKTLSELVAEDNSDKVTERIQQGIDWSTHMLCVVSTHTIPSYWVPFEVGYGYGKVKLGVLTLKGIEEASLPDYMKTTHVVRGTKSLNEFIASLLGESTTQLVAQKALMRHSESEHPLDAVLDWNK